MRGLGVLDLSGPNSTTREGVFKARLLSQIKLLFVERSVYNWIYTKFLVSLAERWNEPYSSVEGFVFELLSLVMSRDLNCYSNCLLWTADPNICD